MTTATVHVRYFARLRESLGVSAEWVPLPDGVRTAAALRAHLATRGGAFAEALAPGKSVRVAVDQIMAGDEAVLADGNEVAFFPPVTGG
jgi:molybdopterin synthase sulfur carrier subunit